MILPPIEQYLIQKEKRLFKGFESYEDVTRFVFDLETTALEPKDGRIFMFGLKTNKGFHKVIECSNEEQEKQGIIDFFNYIHEIKPSIIVSYNGFAFDWYWIFERAKALGLDVKRICKSLNPEKSITQSKGLLKLANEIEEFVQTSIWGYNVIDALHSVRRAQAINSNIKSAGLKYIVQYLEAEDADRIYIDHTDIGSMYSKKEDYWLNIQNGKYKKCGIDLKVDEVCERREDTYIKTTGDNIVERYLDDDLIETLRVDEEFNQGSFLLASLVPTTYQRIATMGTATLWEIQMRAWSYKHKLAIPAIISGIAEPLLSITDTAIVGNIDLNPTEALAAVGIAGSFISAIVWILAQTRSAISAIIAQYYGADNLKDIQQLPAQIIAINVALSLVLYGLTVFFIQNIFETLIVYVLLANMS